MGKGRFCRMIAKNNLGVKGKVYNYIIEAQTFQNFKIQILKIENFLCQISNVGYMYKQSEGRGARFNQARSFKKRKLTSTNGYCRYEISALGNPMHHS